MWLFFRYFPVECVHHIVTKYSDCAAFSSLFCFCGVTLMAHGFTHLREKGCSSAQPEPTTASPVPPPPLVPQLAAKKFALSNQRRCRGWPVFSKDLGLHPQPRLIGKAGAWSMGRTTTQVRGRWYCCRGCRLNTFVCRAYIIAQQMWSALLRTCCTVTVVELHEYVVIIKSRGGEMLPDIFALCAVSCSLHAPFPSFFSVA